jgi:hypothetical protein
MLFIGDAFHKKHVVAAGAYATGPRSSHEPTITKGNTRDSPYPAMKDVVIGALAVAALALPPPAVTAAEWAQPYYDRYNTQLLITTDPSWVGAAEADVNENFRASPPSGANFASLPRSYIWAPTCGPEAENRTFSKIYEIPGEPLQGTFNFEYFGGRDVPFESATLTVNGYEVARLGTTANLPLGKRPPPLVSGELSPEARKAFRFGSNSIVITVSKAALKEGELCRDDMLPRAVGVLADIFLQFGGDLRVDPPRVPLEVRKDVKNRDAVVSEGVAQFVNDGPSAALEGFVTISVTGPGQSLFVESLVAASAPFSNCKAEGAVLNCEFHEFLAGQQGSIRFRTGTKVTFDLFQGGAGRIETLAHIGRPSGFPDPNGSNNSAKAELVLCAAGATDPAC